MAVLFLIISKSPAFGGKDSPPASTIFFDDEKNITHEKTFFSTKKKKTAVLGNTKTPNTMNTSRTSKGVLESKTDKTIEKLLREFSSMDNDAKINLIINLESFEPELLTLAFSDKSADVRLAAVKSLFWLEIDQKNILPFIAMAMNDEASLIRDESYKLMDSLNDKRDILSLIEPAMNSKFSDARLKAVSKFIDLAIPKEEFKSLVVKALSDKDKEVRTKAFLSASFLWNQEFSSEDEAVKYLSNR